MFHAVGEDGPLTSRLSYSCGGHYKGDYNDMDDLMPTNAERFFFLPPSFDVFANQANSK